MIRQGRVDATGQQRRIPLLDERGRSEALLRAVERGWLTIEQAQQIAPIFPVSDLALLEQVNQRIEVALQTVLP